MVCFDCFCLDKIKFLLKRLLLKIKGKDLSDWHVQNVYKITLGMEIFNNKYISFISRIGVIYNTVRVLNYQGPQDGLKMASGKGFIWENKLILKLNFIYIGAIIDSGSVNNDLLMSKNYNGFKVIIGINVD